MTNPTGDALAELNKYIVYSKSNCPRCDQAKAYLEAHNIPYKEVNLDSPNLRDAFIKSYPNVRMMPYVLTNLNQPFNDWKTK